VSGEWGVEFTDYKVDLKKPSWYSCCDLVGGTKFIFMKTILYAAIAVSAIAFTSCGNNKTSNTESSTDTTSSANQSSSSSGNSGSSGASYVDLNTGKTIQISHDDATGITTDIGTGKPVQFYINPITNDTFDTRGRLVNNALILADGGWEVDETKIKSDGDDLKVKTDDMKVKTDGDETKIKTGDSKVKTDGNDSKVKTDDLKIKNDDGQEVKVKDR
jgi:hypothetical protein